MMANAQLKANGEQTFVAPDMTRALRELTDKLGSDAMLLSSRTVAEGVEVIGLPADGALPSKDVRELHTDRRVRDRRRTERRVENFNMEEPLLGKQGADDRVELSRAESKGTFSPDTRDLRKMASELASKIGHLMPSASGEKIDAERLDGAANEEASDNQEMPVIESSLKFRDMLPAEGFQLSEVTQELQSLKSMIAETIANANHADDFLPKPHEYVVMDRLMQSDLAAPLVRALVQTATGDTVSSLWYDCRRRLKTLMSTVDGVEASYSGMVALVGEKGAGKTEAAIKLVAKLAVKYGSSAVVLVAAAESCGDKSALHRVSALTGVGLLSVSADADWADKLRECAQYKYVVIDTSLSDDQRGKELLETLRGTEIPVDEILVLPANAEKRYLQRSITAFKHKNTLATIASFFDRCVSRGEFISTLICEKLSLMYLGTGTLLPEYLVKPELDMLLDDVLGNTEFIDLTQVKAMNGDFQDESQRVNS